MTIEIVAGSYLKGSHLYEVGNELKSNNTPLTYTITNLYQDTYHHWADRVEMVDNNGLKYDFALHFVNENFYKEEDKTINRMENVKMNEMDINKFKVELENRFDNAHDHTEKYDYLEAVAHTLSFLEVNNEQLDQMLYELHERVNKEHKAEYGI